MEPTKQELKTLSSAIKVAGRYGSELQKKFNVQRVEKLADKIKQIEDSPTRKIIFDEIKNHNKKQSFGGVNKAIDDLVIKYNVKIDVPPSIEGAGADPKARVIVDPKSKDPSESLTPRIPEYQPKLRGGPPSKKPPPPSKETTAPPRPKLTKAQSKDVGKIMPDEKVEEKEEAKPKEPIMEEPEAKPEQAEPVEQEIATPPVEQNEPKKPFTRKVEEVKDDLTVDPNINPPSKRMGKSLEDLSVEEINKDLDYFYKNFKNRLKKLKRTKSKNLKVLQRFYRRVLALLRVEKPEEDKKKIGIVIKGTDFIKNALKEIISENTIDGLSAEDLLVNIEGKEDTQKSDAGAYEFKKGTTSGKLYAEQEPIARLIPTTDEKQVKQMNPKRRLKVSRISNTKTEYRGLEKTAKQMVNRNPFLSAKQPTIKLKKIY